MHEMKLTNGEKIDLNERGYQQFKDSIGNGPRFIEIETHDKTLFVSKDHIVSVV